MAEIIKSTYTIALPIVLGYIVWLLKTQKTERTQEKKQHEQYIKANNKGTMLLLRMQLIEYHDKYISLGEIPSYAYENFVEIYETYHELGGNGMVSKMYEDIKALPIKKKEGLT